MIRPWQGVWPKIHPDAFVAENAVIIGDVEIGAGSSIWYNVVLRGDVDKIRIGTGTNIQDGTVVHVSRVEGGSTIIGNNITIGHMALIHACTLEDGCFIGMKACVMDRAVVAAGSMIGAGALLTAGKTTAPGELWLGSPAKAVRALNDGERAMLVQSPADYARLASSYRLHALE
jgi:carbonic anhydrase/acetyltransferase-like protein (isoleucine patch superfamily)